MLSMVEDGQDIYDGLWKRFGTCFRYKTLRMHGERCFRGILGKVGRERGWQPAECLGDSSPYAVQSFLTRIAWEANDICVHVICKRASARPM